MARKVRGLTQQKPLTLDDEITYLRGLDLKGLRARWQSMFKHQPPTHLPRHLLFGILAYRLQANALGDVAPATIRLLKQIVAGGGSVDTVALTIEFDHRRSELKPGTVLMREWNGRPERVMVVDNGFAWNGKIYDSLSSTAFAITQTKWNGPRFFGLRDKKANEIVLGASL